eukprot:Phypoly_transcript_00432.p1 GENE.Phypoly_transcript_00432~~Phypoly_transcript_00432.p1  ORF type:complete len:533 (+),score=108.98 Phypoly_transcript_00432:3173-4771(+)
MSDSTNLGKIASNNSYFLFNSFENLRQVFTYLHRTAASPPKIDINARGSHSATLQILLPPEVLKFKEWEVEMFDFSTNKWKKMGKSQAEIQNLYNLAANTKFKLRGRALLMNDTWTDFSTDFQFRTMIEEPLAPIIRDAKLRAEECKKMCELISSMRPNSRLRKAGVTKYNLLFLGRMGAGKSSLLDSMASAINGQYTVLAPFRTSLETVTQTYMMYPLTRSAKREPQIAIGDIYGWSETNYKNLELGYILGGNAKSGYTEIATGFRADKNLNPFFRPDPTFNDKIHAVIVVVSATTVGSTAEMSKLNEFYTFLTSAGYQPIFVLTKVDRLPDEVLIGHNENVFDSGIVDTTLNVFCKLSNIPRASVLPIINYTGPYTQGPDYVIEMLILNALKATLRQAETFLEKHEDSIVEDAKKAKTKSRRDGKKKGKKDSSEESEEESDNSDLENISEEDSDKKSKKKGDTPKSSPSKKEAPNSPSASIFGLIEAAKYLSIAESEMLVLVQNKEISGKKIGANWRITKDAIDKYLNSC